jgi:hypothetical protein
MLKYIIIVFFFFALSVRGAAQRVPFQLIDSTLKTLSESDVTKLDSQSDKGIVLDSGRSLYFSQTNITIVVRTGPSDDMLSYRIQGLRNPTLGVRPGATLHILFVNMDDDMHHDIRLGGIVRKFPTSPSTTGTVGTTHLAPNDEEKFFAEAITLHAVDSGAFIYYCSVKGHAVGGMWGNIVIGSNPDALSRVTYPPMPMQMDTTPGAPMDMKHGGMEMMPGMNMQGMNMPSEMHGILFTEPMSQEGSGTSWLPASSPMYMLMTNIDDWMLMAHGDIFPRYDYQGGPRGGQKFDAPNMFMGMLEHNVGTDGQFTGHLMMSLDPITEGGKGYPLLFQTGESYGGQKLVDDQHPHNLFDEVSAAYSYRLAQTSSAFVYFGYPGEPALGPPVFMHRPSAMSNPDAPISHHWMDATHVTFGVATAGITEGDWKLEGSAFNGSEPSQYRYGFDKFQINSYSGRLSFNPTNDLAFQISSGFLENPEGDSVNVIRSTASAIYTKNYGNGSWWATTLAWGENHEIGYARMEAFLLESQYTITNYTFFGRTEYVQKSDEELALSNNRLILNDLSYVAVGLTRNLLRIDGIDTEIGGQVSYHFVPESLIPLYTAHPISYEIFFALHPSLMD